MVTVDQLENDIASKVNSIISKDIGNLASVVSSISLSDFKAASAVTGKDVNDITRGFGMAYSPYGTEAIPAITGSSAKAATSLFSTDILPKQKGASMWRVMVVLKTTNSVFNLIIKTSNVTVTASFNSGTALTAGSVYTFDIPVFSDFKYNFQVTTATTVDFLAVMQIIP